MLLITWPPARPRRHGRDRPARIAFGGSRRVSPCHPGVVPVWLPSQQTNAGATSVMLTLTVRGGCSRLTTELDLNLSTNAGYAASRLALSASCSKRITRPSIRLSAQAQASRIGRGRSDHILPLSAGHVRWVLAEFVSYYNQDRPHRSLGLETPVPGPRQPDGEVVSRPVLNGLHHVYERAA